MIEIWKRTELEKLLRKYELHLSKARGQNFLIDKNVLDKIARGAEIAPDDHVVEIGPGAGALTVRLAQEAGRVTAVEIDGRLLPVLSEVTEGLANIAVIHDDFLKTDLREITAGVAGVSSVTGVTGETGVGGVADVADVASMAGMAGVAGMTDVVGMADVAGGGRFKLVGNLPYNITTPVIAKVFEPGPDGLRTVLPSLMVFMVQKEVAERLLSPPGKKTYGAVSVLMQYYAEAELLFEVSREVFVPRPNVDSAVIRLMPRDLSADDPVVASRMFRLVRAGFDMRRKILRNSLARAGFPEEELLAALKASGIDPSRRAETLSPRDFYTLAAAL